MSKLKGLYENTSFSAVGNPFVGVKQRANELIKQSQRSGMRYETRATNSKNTICNSERL